MFNFLPIYIFLLNFCISVSLSEHANVRFNVIPSRFVLNVPFNARCTVGNFNPTGQNFEITFWMLSDSVEGVSHPVKLPIGTYLITNTGKNICFVCILTFDLTIIISVAPHYRVRIKQEGLMTVTPGFQQTFPHYELMVVPRSNRTRTVYGCYFKNGISLNSQEIYSNVWDANGGNGIFPKATFVLVLTLISVLKFYTF